MFSSEIRSERGRASNSEWDESVDEKKHLLTIKSSAVENNKRIANCQNQQNDKRVMGSHYWLKINAST